MGEKAEPVRLMPETLAVFDRYISEAERAMDGTLGGGQFLWSDADAKRAKQVRKGQVVADFWPGKGPVHVPAGLIHDWAGAAFAGGAALDRVLAVMQDYDNHKNLYKPEVIDSKLASRHGQDFKIYLRVLKKKIITVVLDTDHDVRYASLGGGRWTCRSHTTRIAEVDDAGKPGEKVHEPDTGYGFMWRLNSYWRLEERDEGVYMECRAISLTRDVPFALRWIIEPMVRSLPKESLIHTLQATRSAAALTAP